ncbi:MAG: ATP-binding cassette domain-containing protein [Flavobacteriales bacterium]|uniref:peptidase domain-containing ABC transporter n=1 Tax=Candidatus Ulvibacter alkanivorans TaxID=2267620 RepID=UPI000DF2C39F|nr:ATP-binding cassette domain-containing protein [Candidatus Ulvibacter alkanivorans]MCH2490388.1 ATP-binding cassette domain-containing protein [Flavobacteriales bacterium]
MKNETMTPWRRLIRLLQLDRRDVQQIFYYAIFGGIVNLSLPLGIQAIINLIQGAQISTSWVVLVILVTAGVAFAGLLQLMQFRISENIQQKIFTRASFEFAYRFPKIKMSELRDYYPPELANRFFDTLVVQKGITKILLDFPAALLQIIFGLLLLSFYHPFFIIYGIVLIATIYVLFKYTAKRGMATSLEESKHKYRIAHWIQEVARSVVSFKLSGKTNLSMSKNDLLVTDYLAARENHFRVLVHQFIQMISFKVLVTAGLLLIGGILVLNQEMNIGQFVAAEIVILLIISAVEKLILRLESFYDVLTSLEKMGQVVDKELEPQEGSNPFDKTAALHIELEHVGYEVKSTNKTLLRDINLKIDSSTRMVIKGPSGAGKTTLLHIISAISSPSEGNMYINDLAIQGIHLNSYRSALGQSLPEESPFEGTIRDNITFGDTTTSTTDIYGAIEVTGLTDFVKKQRNGLDTMIYPEGKQLSYTIAKKIVLARSIVRQPKLLLLKDPLDQFMPEEKQHLIKYLTASDRPWGLIVVSQNSDWDTYCDQKVYMERGTIISKTE